MEEATSRPESAGGQHKYRRNYDIHENAAAGRWFFRRQGRRLAAGSHSLGAASPLNQLREQCPERHDHRRRMGEAVYRFVREIEHGLEGMSCPGLFLKVEKRILTR